MLTSAFNQASGFAARSSMPIRPRVDRLVPGGVDSVRIAVTRQIVSSPCRRSYASGCRDRTRIARIDVRRSIGTGESADRRSCREREGQQRRLGASAAQESMDGRVGEADPARLDPIPADHVEQSALGLGRSRAGAGRRGCCRGGSSPSAGCRRSCPPGCRPSGWRLRRRGCPARRPGCTARRGAWARRPRRTRSRRAGS